MKFFNYEALYTSAHGDSSKIVQYFKEMPSVGEDFIINPNILWKYVWLTDRQIAEYLGLCALRSYADYKYSGIADLSLDLVPKWVPIEVVQSNPLVKIENSTIKFFKENK